MAEGKGGSKVLWMVLGALGLILLCCGGAALLGVGGFRSVMETGEQVDPVVTEFLTRISAGNYDAAYELTAPGFRADNDVAALADVGAGINGGLGAFGGSATRTGINLRANAGVSVGDADANQVPGTSVECTYSTAYESGPATLTITLQKQPDDTWKVWSFFVKPD